MEKLIVRGGRRLEGSVQISGAKNAALPEIAACLLSPHRLTLHNLPAVADVATMLSLMAHYGVVVGDRLGGSITLDANAIRNGDAPYEAVRRMRATFLVLGPLLARFGSARVSLPGGCAIGARPVDLHLKALSAMGADVAVDGGYVQASAPKGLKGARVIFPHSSVGATETALMAAVLAQGETELVNAAREPEIEDLALCLMRMGARIEGIGTDRLRIQGVGALVGGEHPVVADRIEAGTYACAAAITGGEVLLGGARLDHLGAVARVLREAGVGVAEEPAGLRVSRMNGLHGVDVVTEPFPGFATDMQAQFMALMCVAQGASMVTETIFENRFMHVPELARMGARINVHGASAIVRGVPSLSGAPVMATDLRASVSLVLAGLAARGETIVNRVYHLDRGYERLEDKLAAVGADVERMK